ncbi:glycine--tRNA ligase subunit beta [Azotosporobacter soli]|uniref:glycine--tRNA ligase subunit beta n=1 Tax=Azotosporobacter soli TaxID=3055040 RepID=UPI0031FE4FCD
MAQELLFEIGTEEIPARFMPGVLKQLDNLARTKLAELRIAHGELKALGTPRRMVLTVRGIAERQADVVKESKGPSLKIAYDEAGNPSKACAGFARGQGVSVEELVQRDGYVYAIVEEKGQATETVMAQFLTDLLSGLAFPKNMRWGNWDVKFVRPVRWMLALLDGKVVPVEITGVLSGNKTRGHRFLSSGEFAVASIDQYLQTMREQHVLVDQDERRNLIRQQVQELAVAQGGVASIDEELLEEVVYLVEYPTPLCGRFEEEYLALPPEAVMTPMREHQRYFPVKKVDGSLLPMFITVRNGGSEHIDIVRHGNERVLRARLADAKFFFEEDKKVSLAQRVEKLKTIVFQDGLGTMHDKVERLGKLSLAVADAVGIAKTEAKDIARGALLAKADLVTGMVCEFTELQGIMGREYAKLNGESDAVAETIFEHYLPRFAGDELPATPAGQAVSIADKMDNIVATFSRGLIPTGSQDPYALRRQALGIVNILLAGRYHVSLLKLCQASAELLHVAPDKKEKLMNELADFFRLRLKNVLSEAGIRYDIVDAVMAVGCDDVYDAWLRAQAVAEAVDGKDWLAMAQSFTRAANLLKHGGTSRVKKELLSDPAEVVLFERVSAVQDKAAVLLEAKKFAELLSTLGELAEPIDAFFDAVMVMADDIAVKENRLSLLHAIVSMATPVVDLSKIVTA